MLEREIIKQKIILIGNPYVGKTSLVKKYVLNVYTDDYISTIGYKVGSKSIIYPSNNGDRGIELKLLIWDLMGYNSCRLVPTMAYKNSNGAIIVCDITRKDTLLNLSHLATTLLAISPKIKIVFLANKFDLKDQSQFGEKEIADIATAFHVPYWFTSAKSGQNVDFAFYILGKLILDSQDA